MSRARSGRTQVPAPGVRAEAKALAWGTGFAGATLAVLTGGGARQSTAQERFPGERVDNVLIVTFDGFRPQEMFGGYDAALNTKADGGVGKPESLAARFGRATPEARREALLPFIW